MGFLDFFRSKPRQATDAPPFRLYLEEHEHDSESQSGRPLHGYGYALRDDRDRALSWDEGVLAANGIEVAKLAGTSHRLDVVQDPAFAPGSRLTLRPDPGNRYDEHAVGVWDAAGKLQAGFVAGDRSKDISDRLRRERLEAYSLWEWRDESGQRCGLRMLLCPPGALAQTPRPLR